MVYAPATSESTGPRMIRRALVTLTLALGILFGGLAAPAQASTGHWCGHSGSHYWTTSGKQFRSQFRSHWYEPWNGGYRHKHEDNVTMNGNWVFIDTYYC